MLHQNEYWCNLVSEHVGVGSSSEPFSSQRGDVESARELVEESRMACLHLVLEGVPAVDDQLVERQRLLGDGQVDHRPQLLRVLEVDHFCVSVILYCDVVQQDVHNLVEKFPSFGVCLLSISFLADRPQFFFINSLL